MNLYSHGIPYVTEPICRHICPPRVLPETQHSCRIQPSRRLTGRELSRKRSALPTAVFYWLLHLPLWRVRDPITTKLLGSHTSIMLYAGESTLPGSAAEFVAMQK